MTDTAVICLSTLVLAVIVGTFAERHVRYWRDRDFDRVRTDVLDALATARRAESLSDDARTIAVTSSDGSARAVEAVGAMTARVEAVEAGIRDISTRQAFRP